MMLAYSIEIPTKPYLKKYIQALYGLPVVFKQSNLFGMCLMGFMDRKFYYRQNETLVHKAFDVFDEQLEIFLPRWWMLQSHYGTDIPAQNIILINKLFEERFDEDLTKYCLIKGGKIKTRIEDFCITHGISIDDDITFDALKQKEYRERKKIIQRQNKIAKLL